MTDLDRPDSAQNTRLQIAIDKAVEHTDEHGQTAPTRPADDTQLPPRHQLFVEYYANPDSPSFGCARRSYLRIYRCSKRSANTNAWRLLTYEGIQRAVRERFEQDSVGIERRIAALANLLDAETETRKEYDAEGRLTRTVVTSASTAAKLKVIDMLNKLDHSYP